MKFIQHAMSPPEEIGANVWNAIDAGAPFVHVVDLPFNGMSPSESERYIKDLAGSIGRTTLTAGVPDTEIWRLNRTTSPSTQFIPYHTDNPYLGVPEKVVSFWNVKSSSQGGANLILPVNDLLEWADSKPEYKDTLQEIEDTPVAFSHGLESTVGRLLEPISGSARFDMKYMDETAKLLGNIFRTILNDPEVPAQTVKLSEGDVLFFDNEKTLHARNEYSDLARVSLRVRMAR